MVLLPPGSYDHINFSWIIRHIFYCFRTPCPNTGEAILRSKLVDEKYRVRFPVALLDLAVRSLREFRRNSRKYVLESLRMTPYGGHTTYNLRSNKRTIGLKPTTTTTTSFKRVLQSSFFFFSYIAIHKWPQSLDFMHLKFFDKECFFIGHWLVIIKLFHYFQLS